MAEHGIHKPGVVGSIPTSATNFLHSFVLILCYYSKMVTKWKEQKLAIKLRQKGKSLNEIAHDLRVSKSSASIWVRHVQLTKKQRTALKKRELECSLKGLRKVHKRWKEYRKRHPKVEKGPRWPKRIVEYFFDTWTPEMAYVLGYFAADGCMYQVTSNKAYFIEFVSIDKDLIESVRGLMRASNKVEALDRPKCQTRYKLRICSKKLFNRLKELGFSPAKSLVMKFPDVPKILLHHFVRGYLDGDGCVYFKESYRQDRKKQRKVLLVRFTCGSKKFLQVLRQKIQKIANNKQIGSLHPHNNAWDLSYGNETARQLYNFMYPTTTVPHLGRKKAKFEEAFVAMVPW